MGVLRRLRPQEDRNQYDFLTTKVVRDWRKRPTWIRRSRLVAREFKTWTPWTQELFAPASSLGVIHGLMSYAQSRGLELVTLDVKDAYLTVKQKAPVIVEVDARLFGENEVGKIPYVLERLLPGQRIAASEWFQFMKGMLEEAGMSAFAKEPTLFKNSNGGNGALVLHADDGLLASTAEERRALMKKLGNQVKVQVSDPLKEVGDEIEFLKRKYTLTKDGIVMYSGRRHLEGLLNSLGPNLKERDTPADPSFLEIDLTDELPLQKSKQYKECVGRLLYLSHTRPDIQFGVCVLASKMSRPTTMALKWLLRVVGYLKRVPHLGFLIKPVINKACLDYAGDGHFEQGSCVVLESVTDADWAGCKKSRRSRSSIQIYLGGSLLASLVRSQRSVALSSGESEFIAMVGGATEVIYLKECLEFVVNGFVSVEAVLRSDSAVGRGIAQRIGCGRVRHLDCGLLWIQEAIKKKIMRPAPISGQKNPADIGTKPLAGPRLRELLCRAGAIAEDGERYGEEDLEAANQRATIRQVMRSGVRGPQVKKYLPVLLILAQIATSDGAIEGLSVGTVAVLFEETVFAVVSTLAVSLVVMALAIGATWAGISIFRWALLDRTGQGMRGLNSEDAWTQTSSGQLNPSSSSSSTFREVSVQADREMTCGEQRFIHEYVERATFLENALHEEHETVKRCESALKDCRGQIRQLEAELIRARANSQVPQHVAIATNRGRAFHRPGCPHLRSSNSTREYEACTLCFRNL